MFQTKIINELRTKLNRSMNKLFKLETIVFNMASLVNVLDNKSRDKNILINYVREDTSRTLVSSVQLSNILSKISIRTSLSEELIEQRQSGNSPKNRPIIALLLNKQQCSQSPTVTCHRAQQYIIPRQCHGQVTKVPGKAPHITAE